MPTRRRSPATFPLRGRPTIIRWGLIECARKTSLCLTCPETPGMKTLPCAESRNFDLHSGLGREQDNAYPSRLELYHENGIFPDRRSWRLEVSLPGCHSRNQQESHPAKSIRSGKRGSRSRQRTLLHGRRRRGKRVVGRRALRVARLQNCLEIRPRRDYQPHREKGGSLVRFKCK